MKPKVQDLYKQNRIAIRHDFHVALGYDTKVKHWKFLGYVCPKCGTGLKTQYVAIKHTCQPQKLKNYKRRDETNLDYVKTVSGKPFKKLDFNQN